MIKIRGEIKNTLDTLISSEIDKEFSNEDELILILQELRYNSDINESDLPFILSLVTDSIDAISKHIFSLYYREENETDLYHAVTDRKKLRDLESYLRLVKKLKL